MTMLLTFHATARRRVPGLLAVALAAAVLIGAVLPASACEKASPFLVANGPAPTSTTAVFTGEFINGVPVYRLPTINVVGRRPAEVAKTQRNDAPARGRSRANSAAGPSHPGRNVANASREVNEIKRCVG